MSVDQRYVFVVEWFDQAASLVRPYYLTYYPPDKTLEMVTSSFNLSMISKTNGTFLNVANIQQLL